MHTFFFILASLVLTEILSDEIQMITMVFDSEMTKSGENIIFPVFNSNFGNTFRNTIEVLRVLRKDQSSCMPVTRIRIMKFIAEVVLELRT